MGWKTRAFFGAMNKARLPSPAPSPPRYVRLTGDHGDDERRQEGSSHGRIKKGYVPVVVGSSDGVDGERFLIPAQFMGDPSIVSLLEMSADELECEQEGVLRIACKPDRFRNIIKHLPFKTIS